MPISSFMNDQDPGPQQAAPAVETRTTETFIPVGPPGTPEDQVRAMLIGNTTTDAIVNAVDNGYSRELQQRGAALTRFLQHEHNSPDAKATYIDPNEFQALRAFGRDDKDAARTLLDRAGAPVTQENIDDLAAEMRHPVSAPGQGLVYTQEPHAIRDMFTNAPQAGAIIPGSAYFAPNLRIEGLTHAQNLEFIDRHEGWHEADTQNMFTDITRAQMGKFDPEQPESMLGNPVQLAALARVNRQESLADVGAAGDMIRNGADPAIIDHIAAWRHQSGEIGHMTGNALDGLERKINEMGVEKFRTLSDDDAHNLYNAVATQNSLPPAQAEAAVRYVTGTAAERATYDGMGTAASPDVAGALSFLKPYTLPPPSDAEKPDQHNQMDPDVARQLSNYHPIQLMRDRAFADGGMITPATIAKAYGELQDELRQDIDRQPDNRLWQAQAQKLQENFPNAVQMTDYIHENATRGVNILKAAPELKGFNLQTGDAPASPAAAPPAPTQPKSRAASPSS